METPPTSKTTIAKVGALKPVNANEADLAAQCVADRAQAGDLLRLTRLHAHDIGPVVRLNAQYRSMLRTATAVYTTLMRTQAVRLKREKIDGAANQDAWTQHITEDYMMRIIDPEHEDIAAVRSKRERAEAASAEATTGEAMPPEAPRPEATRPQAMPAASVEPKFSDDVSEFKLDAQNMAFETYLSTLPWHQGGHWRRQTKPDRDDEQNHDRIAIARPGRARERRRQGGLISTGIKTDSPAASGRHADTASIPVGRSFGGSTSRAEPGWLAGGSRQASQASHASGMAG